MHYQLEGLATAKSDRRKVTHVTRREPTDAERLRECYNRCVDEAQAEVRESTVHFHRTCELAEGRRRVGEGTFRQILHERLHRLAFVTKKVVNLGENEAWDVASTRAIDGKPKEPVIWRLLDEIVEQRSRVADERCRSTTRHGTARARRRAPSVFERRPRFAASDAFGIARAREQDAGG